MLPPLHLHVHATRGGTSSSPVRDVSLLQSMNIDMIINISINININISININTYMVRVSKVDVYNNQNVQYET